MGKKYSKKVHQKPIREEWAESLLASKGEAGEPLYESLQQAKTHLANLVHECVAHLEANPLTPVVAQAVAREIGRRGTCNITINEQGVVLLEVKPKKSGGCVVKKRGWNTGLPSIKKLREQAAEFNLDISGFGRSKSKISRAIQEVLAMRETNGKTQPDELPKPKKKMFKTGDAVTPPKVVDPAELPFDESTELPEDILEGNKPDLKAALDESDGIDIDAILDGNTD